MTKDEKFQQQAGELYTDLVEIITDFVEQENGVTPELLISVMVEIVGSLKSLTIKQGVTEQEFDEMLIKGVNYVYNNPTNKTSTSTEWN